MPDYKIEMGLVMRMLSESLFNTFRYSIWVYRMSITVGTSHTVSLIISNARNQLYIN